MPIEVPNLPAVVLSTEGVEGIQRPRQRSGRKQRQFSAQLEKQTGTKDNKKVSAIGERGEEEKRQNQAQQNKKESNIKAKLKSEKDIGQRIDIKV